MPPRRIDPIAARAFAVEVIEKLRQGGHEAVWAGGCVRDQLLDRVPLDYDVATAARPDAVRNIFGREKFQDLAAANLKQRQDNKAGFQFSFWRNAANPGNPAAA